MIPGSLTIPSMNMTLQRNDRLCRITDILSAGSAIPFDALQQRLNISAATLKRDIRYLKEIMRAPITYDRSVDGYTLKGELTAKMRAALPKLWFNDTEIFALLTMLQMLDEIQPGLLSSQIEPLRTRFNTMLNSQKNSPDEIRDRIRILKTGQRRIPNAAFFSVIAKALLDRERLLITHFNRREERETERELSPQRLIHERGTWYLGAWCHLRNELRTFGIDAISKVSVTGKKAKEVSKQELDKYFESGYGIFSGKKVQWAKLRFTPKRARWTLNEVWHPEQKITLEKSGHLLLQVPYANMEELVRDVLRQGEDVEVISPASLREAVVARLEATRAVYS